MAGLATSFGSGAMTNSIADMEKAAAFLIIGSNTTENHPIIGDLVKRAVTRKGAKLVVVDPRRIELADHANVFLQVHPGHNIPVLNGMMHVILEEDLHDRAYIEERCEGFDDFAGSLEDFSPERVEEITGLSAESLRVAARLYATSKPASILYCMGVTQHSQGTDAVKALANLAMLCGNVGVEGGGLNPLRGQNNVQGACDMGALPNVYPGYQKVDDAGGGGEVREGVGAQGPDQARAHGDRGHPRRHRGHGEGALRDRREPDDHRPGRAARRARRSTSSTCWWCRTSSSPRPPRRPTWCCPRLLLRGEGRHLHQHRAPGPAGAHARWRPGASRGPTGQILRTCPAAWA